MRDRPGMPNHEPPSGFEILVVGFLGIGAIGGMIVWSIREPFVGIAFVLMFMLIFAAGGR